MVQWLESWVLGSPSSYVVPRVGYFHLPSGPRLLDASCGQYSPPRVFLITGGVFHPRALRVALPVIWVGVGVLVWLLARNSAHIGASGLVYGLMAWVVTLGILRRTRVDLILMLVALFFYSGIISGLLPTDMRISFEGHSVLMT